MKYEFNGCLYEWVRMDGDENARHEYEWWEDFDNKDAVFVDCSEGNWGFDENNLITSAYVMQNNVIREHKVYHSRYGAYVVHRGRRYYVQATLG